MKYFEQFDKRSIEQTPSFGFIYRAEVVDNNDPAKLGRLKVRVMSLNRDISIVDLAWAEPSYPMGGSPNNGAIFIPTIGSTVWVAFEEGNPNRPVWVGSFFGMPAGVSELPFVFQGKNTDPATQDTEPLINEPASWKAKYPTNYGIRTPNGIVIEWDDTPNNRRIHLFHPSGSHEEFRENGDVVLHVKGNHHIVVDGNVEELYKGNHHQVVLKNQLKEIHQNRTEQIFMNKDLTVGLNHSEIVLGDKDQQVEGNKSEQILGNSNEAILQSKIEEITLAETRIIGTNQNETVLGARVDLVGLTEIKTVTGLQTQVSLFNRVDNVLGNKTETITGNETKTVSGSKTESVVGNELKTTGGTKTENVVGAVVENYNSTLQQTVQDTITILSKRLLNLLSSANLVIQSELGNIEIDAPGNASRITITADFIAGVITLSAGGTSSSIP